MSISKGTPNGTSRNVRLKDVDRAATGSLAGMDWTTVVERLVEADDRGFLLVGPGRRVLEANRSARTMLGYEGPLPGPVAEVVRDVDFGFAVGDAFHDRREGWLERYLPHPDRLLRFHVIPILSPTEEVALLAITVEDITRLRHLETVRRDFVANVSHELRTPIASIHLLVETLLEGALDDPEAARHFLGRIDVETQSMGRLVEELLELSRLESGTLSLRIEGVVVGELLHGVTDRLAPAAREKEIDVEVELQDNLPPILADRERLEQVLMNLVHNAIKFTPERGAATIRARRHGPGVEIEVVDTGVGMDAAEAGRIFERFYKVDKGRSRLGGSGLGLAIARHLLELHGSRLRVVSEPGRGSRFYFSLPAAADSSG